MERLTITAQLKVPIILGSGYLTFDALLAALIFERTGDVETAHKSVPLSCTDGLFHASRHCWSPSDRLGLSQTSAPHMRSILTCYLEISAAKFTNRLG
jgi:hypothetical protein